MADVMRLKPILIAVSIAVVAAAFGGLFYSSLAEGTEYYKHVDEVMHQPEQWYGKRLQLHGFVAAGSILRRRETLDYKFTVESKGQTVPVRYTGVVPDTFKDGSEVVLKGRLSSEGFAVEPDGVMAKCPSKYDASPNAPVKVPDHAKPVTTAS
jgi:cytochrome c-type biogenesis protein CcmE